MSMYTSHLSRSDEQRLSDRARLFERLAERKRIEASLRSLDEALRELDAQADSAADAHNTAAQPIQAELAEPSITAARRSKLLSELATLNESLEKKIASVKTVRRPLESQKRELQSIVAPMVSLEGKIASSAPLADRCAAWASSRGLQFAHQRLEVASKSHRAAQHELRQAESEPAKYDLVQFRRRELEWRSECESAGRMLSAARDEHEAAHRRLMAE